MKILTTSWHYTSAFLGTRTLRRGGSSIKEHFPCFQTFPSRDMLHSIFLFIYPLLIHPSIDVYFQHKQDESHVSSTIYVQLSSKNKYVCWQDTHWSCSSDAMQMALTRSPCEHTQVHVHLVPGDPISCSMQGDFWEEREFDCARSPGCCLLDTLG